MKIAYFDRFTIELPDEAVSDCHHQGDCTEDVSHWQSKLSLNIEKKLMIDELEGYGAWGREELEDLEDYELEEKLIWIAAGNIQDEEN